MTYQRTPCGTQEAHASALGREYWSSTVILEGFILPFSLANASLDLDPVLRGIDVRHIEILSH